MNPWKLLSKREKDVAVLLIQGKSNQQIALELGRTERTAEAHLTTIYKKLGVSSRTEASSILWQALGEFAEEINKAISENKSKKQIGVDFNFSWKAADELLKLWKSTGNPKLGESTVEKQNINRNNRDVKTTKNFYQKNKLWLFLGVIIISVSMCIRYYPRKTPPITSTPTPKISETTPQKPTSSAIIVTASPTAIPTPINSISIMLDDFNIPPYPGESVYPYNRLQGDRGIVNGSVLEGGNGLITSTIATGNTWGGAWMSLNHPVSEGLPINFSRVLPPQIRSEYQSQITGITIEIERGTPNRPFKIELKDGDEVRWVDEITLTGGEQILKSDLPPLDDINQLVWILDRGLGEEYVVLDSIVFTATARITDTATAAFVWSYGMLLNNWDPYTGLVRDKSRDPSGKFDGIQVTGSLAAATALADQLGIVDHQDAIQIVEKIGETLLLDLPKHKGLWPHWMRVSPDGGIDIVNGTEWSSVDTAIAAIGLLTAQSSLGLDTSGTESMIQSIDWDALEMEGGISHGYDIFGERLPYAWDVFGSESWLVELAHATATGHVSALPFATRPTANGSGFIDEMAWLFVPPPSGLDYWSNDWNIYRSEATQKQTSYFTEKYPVSCLAQTGLFGLSAGEIPWPSTLQSGSVYQAFGVGGRFSEAIDGNLLLNMPVTVPHYAGLAASLRPEESLRMWNWLIDAGYFSPLTNVESLAFPGNSNCDPGSVIWNQLKGSWNLSLQTLGWGRYLAESQGQVSALWQAVITNPFLQKGYQLLNSEKLSTTPLPMSTQRVYERECENPDEFTVGQTLVRENASKQEVHGQFGTSGKPPWSALPGYVEYTNIDLPQAETLYLKLRYSKNSEASTPVLIFVDDETIPRATFYPENLGSWENFTWTEPIPLGSIENGSHTIKISTDGQQFGTADLDRFVLEVELASN